MAKTQKTAIADFIAALSKACNKSQILYCDMIYQDELFDFQSEIIDALLEANRDKLFTNSELLEFEHIFGVQDA
jgi:hypothetical protein